MKVAKMIKALEIHDANNKMMTVKECALYLNCSYRTVINRIEKDLIKANEINGKYIIPKLQFVDKIVKEFKKDLQL